MNTTNKKKDEETDYINECWNEIEKKDTKTYQQVKNEWKEVQKNPSIYQQIYWGARRPKQRVNKVVHYKKKRHILNKILVTLGILSELYIILYLVAVLEEYAKTEEEVRIYLALIILSVTKIVLIFKGRKKTEKIILD